MKLLPASLTPNNEDVVVLSDGKTVRLPKASVEFCAWSGPIAFDRYGGKAVLDFRGEALFAELTILRLLESDGWNGVWVDTYRRCFRRNISERIDIPQERFRLFENIQKIAGAKSGCFDVFAWKEEKAIFAESKHRGRDKFRPTQRRWLEAALSSGLAVESFLIVEWTLKEEPKPAASNHAIASTVSATSAPS